jgi:hypothetical protein
MSFALSMNLFALLFFDRFILPFLAHFFWPLDNIRRFTQAARVNLHEQCQ